MNEFSLPQFSRELQEHLDAHPLAQPADLVKYCRQRAFDASRTYSGEQEALQALAGEYARRYGSAAGAAGLRRGPAESGGRRRQRPEPGSAGTCLCAGFLPHPAGEGLVPGGMDSHGAAVSGAFSDSPPGGPDRGIKTPGTRSRYRVPGVFALGRETVAGMLSPRPPCSGHRFGFDSGWRCRRCPRRACAPRRREQTGTCGSRRSAG